MLHLSRNKMSASMDQDSSTTSKTKTEDSAHTTDEKDVSTNDQISKEQVGEHSFKSNEQKLLQWRKDDHDTGSNMQTGDLPVSVTLGPGTTLGPSTVAGEAVPTSVCAENQGKSDIKSKSEGKESGSLLEEQSVSENDNKIQPSIDFAKPTLVPFKLPTLLPKTGKRTAQGLKQNEETKTNELGAKSAKEHNVDSEESMITSGKEVDKDKIPDSGDIDKADERSSSKQAVRDKEKSNSSNEKYQARKKPRPQFEPSPAEKLSIPPLPYKEPSWGGTPDKKYLLDVLKGGRILETIPLYEKAFHLFGRLDVCDVVLEHPSISRYHLVLQYRKVGDSERDPGYYLYDLGSTHGSTFNKSSLKPRVYYRVRVGHHFKLGGSKRSFILQGPPEDEEAESELSVSELKELRRKQLAEQGEIKKKREDERMETEEVIKEDEGISWGLRDDAEPEEIDMDKNPFNVMSQAEKEATYVKDPKKTLRGYFEREGVELEYNVEEKGSGFNRQYVCKVELPIDNSEGEPIIAEAAVSGKKKEAVAACAMEACRILDAHGVLRQAVHESKQKKKKNWAEDDFYDSDDDSYLDRTGMIEKKRTQRMMKAGVIKQEVDTYDTLIVKLENVNKELEETQKELNVLNQEQNTGKEEDTLDAFINQLKSGTLVDKTKRPKMKLRAIELRKEQEKLKRLIRLVQPASVSVGSTKPQSKFAALSQRLPMTGVMKGRKPSLVKPKIQTKFEATSSFVSSSTHDESKFGKDDSKKVEDVEEEEEVEEEEDAVTTTMTSSTSQEVDMQDTKAETIDRVTDKISEESGQDKMKKDTERVQEQKKEERVLSPGKQQKHHSSQQKRPKRVLGPQMGPLIKFKQFMNRDEPEEETSEAPGAKKKKEEDFADWIPPDDQKGDGRTFLNEKYGY